MSSVFLSSNVFHESYYVWPINVANWFAASNVSFLYLPVELSDCLIPVLWAFPLIISYNNLLNWYHLVFLLYLREQITQILITILRSILSLW